MYVVVKSSNIIGKSLNIIGESLNVIGESLNVIGERNVLSSLFRRQLHVILHSEKRDTFEFCILKREKLLKQLHILKFSF